MKKALVVGGASGIGLALSLNLIERGYDVQVLDIAEPEVKPPNVQYRPCDLFYFDDGLFESLSRDAEIECLAITAGFGRVARFECLHPSEIGRLMAVNATAGIKIARLFCKRFLGNSPFYCVMMGSIAGLVSSPAFSVYAASKAAVCRFAESFNIELEAAGSPNRILNVSPGSIAGTRFNGGQNDLDALKPLAAQIADKMFQREELFIPQYEEVYKDVLKRYRDNPHVFGLTSYEYKAKSGRMREASCAKIGYLSGTFDLFHIGHLNILRRARALCDYLVVGVHPDASHKKKEAFIPFGERKEIVRACKYVDRVIDASPEDSEAWDRLHYDKLFVGSDYKGSERFARYETFFRDKGVEIVYLPYTQGTSSTQIRHALEE